MRRLTRLVAFAIISIAALLVQSVPAATAPLRLPEVRVRVNPPAIPPPDPAAVVADPVGQLTALLLTLLQPVLGALNPYLPPEVVSLEDQLTTALIGAQYVIEVHDLAGNRKLSQPALAFAPTPLDWAPAAGPEAIALFTPVPGADGTTTVQLNIAPPPGGNTGPANVAITAILSPSKTDRVRVGYIADGRPLPDPFTLTAVTRANNVDVDVVTGGSTAPLSLVGDMFKTENNTRPIGAAARFAPMPANLGLNLDFAGDSVITLNSGTLTSVTLDLVARNLDRTNTLHATTSELPVGTIDGEAASVKFIVDQADDDKVTYKAAGPVTSVNLSAKEFVGTNRVTHAVAEIQGLPTLVTLHKDGPKHMLVSTNGPIGAVALGIGNRRDAILRPDLGVSYVFRQDYGDGTDVLAARVTGLSSADIAWGDDLKVTAAHAGSPFRLLAIDPNVKVDATITNLPASVTLQFNIPTKRLTYTGSATIAEIILNVDSLNGAPLFGRVNKIAATLHGVPSGVDFSTSQADAGGFRVIKFGGSGEVGMVDVSLASAGFEPIGAIEGVRLFDFIDRFYAQVRLANVRGVELKTRSFCNVPPPTTRTCQSDTHVDLKQRGGNNVFIDIQSPKERPDGTLDAAKTEIAHVTAHQLPAHVVIDLLSIVEHHNFGANNPFNNSQSTHTQVSYHGYDANDQPSTLPNSSVAFHGEFGKVGATIDASVVPLPAVFEFCKASTGACTAASGRTPHMSAFVNSSQEVTVNLTSCDNSAQCDRNAVILTNLLVTGLAVDTKPSDAIVGHVMLHTAGARLAGDIRALAADGGEIIHAIIPVGTPTDYFHAEGRLVFYTTAAPPRTQGTFGTANCPDGTGFFTGSPGINVGGFVCTS